jgi:ADP-ribosyl-[dinitrogen reductase] hydrolase
MRAVALAQRSTIGLQIPDLIATEHELTRKEGESFDVFAAVGRAGAGREDDQLI